MFDARWLAETSAKLAGLGSAGHVEEDHAA